MKINLSEKTTLQIISLFVQIIFVFFTVFFGVYVYEMSNDLNFVMAYSLFQSIATLGIEFIIAKFASDRVLRILYKLSFAMALVATALTFTISKDTLYMVFITQFVYGITTAFYYTSYEVATMDKNNKKQMKKFVGINSLLTLLAGTLSPFLSGFIIDYVSYYVLFGILFACALVCLILSFNVKQLCKIDYKASFRQFLKITHSYKSIKMGLAGYGLFKFGQDGLIELLLPVLIFMRTGGNFSVGLYSALATLVAGIVLFIYITYATNKKVAMWVATVVLCAGSIIMIFSGSIITFFVYYFVKKITKEILKNCIYTHVFTFSNGTIAEPFKVEQRLTYSIYNKFYMTLSYGLAYLIYNLIKSEVSLTILLVILSLVQILSTYFILKAEKLRETEIDEKNKTGLNMTLENIK